MAKRKLSESQRVAIRKELGELLKTAKTKAEALRTVSKKYRITTITAGWYAKTLKSAPARAGKPAKAAAPKAKAPVARQAPKVGTPRNGHAPSAGGISGLVADIAAAAQRTLSRARLAQKLVPQWQSYVQKQLSLRKVEKKVREELRAAGQKAQALERKIKELTSR